MSNKKATLADLDELHGEVARQFMSDLRNPEKRTPALLAAAVKFLQNNRVEVDPVKNPAIKGVLDSLPFPTAEGMRDEDYEEGGGRVH